MFKVTPKRKLILWDLYSVIADLNYVNLFETIRGSYGDRLWAYQKIPVHSQILAMKLKVIGGDGIIFESTKSNGHKNIALFFDTDESAKEALEFKEIEFPK